MFRRLFAGSRDYDLEVAEAEERIRAAVARETEAQAAELERTLTLARANSLARLVEEERRIADERRAAVQEPARS
jgi:hypothetical protein